MPLLKSVGGLPAILALVRVRSENVLNAEKRSAYALSEQARNEIVILANIQSFVISSQIIGGTSRSNEIAKYIKASESLLGALPSADYRPHLVLQIDAGSAINQQGAPHSSAPADFVLRNLIEASLTVARELEVKDKSGPNKTDLWSMWVTAVSQVLRHRGFDTNASHHTDKRKHDNESPFVNFMFELDAEIRSLFVNRDLPNSTAALLPIERVKTGLAREISRAREGKPKSLPVLDALGAWKLSNPYLAQASSYMMEFGTVAEEKT